MSYVHWVKCCDQQIKCTPTNAFYRLDTVIYLDFLKSPSARARRAAAPSALGFLGFSRFQNRASEKKTLSSTCGQVYDLSSG